MPTKTFEFQVTAVPAQQDAQASLQAVVNALNQRGAEGWEFKHMMTINMGDGQQLMAMLLQREKSALYLPAGMQ